MKIIKEEPSITQIKIAEMLNVTDKTIKRNINKLKEKKIIERDGSNRKGYWKVIE